MRAIETIIIAVPLTILVLHILVNALVKFVG
jgi:hypothetical protein